jgi:hypothetical protein
MLSIVCCQPGRACCSRFDAFVASHVCGLSSQLRLGRVAVGGLLLFVDAEIAAERGGAQRASRSGVLRGARGGEIGSLGEVRASIQEPSSSDVLSLSVVDRLAILSKRGSRYLRRSAGPTVIIQP